MWLLRKMHMKQKTAYIMKASHCCLEQNAEQKLQMPRSFLGGKVNLHTSHLFSELFIVREQRLLKGPGRGTARRSTLMVGSQAPHGSVCNASVVQETPTPQTYSTSILQSLSHAP